VQLGAQQSATLAFELLPHQYSTVLHSGLRKIFAGIYNVTVGGHQPDDDLGEATSNTVSATFIVKKLNERIIPHLRGGLQQAHRPAVSNDDHAS
jgi:hypothetical protein